jgi:ABC-type transporter Mla MlaB component
MFLSAGLKTDRFAKSEVAPCKRNRSRLTVLTKGRRAMLKITRIDTETEQKLILEGRLTARCIADLLSHWEETRHSRPERRFVVDLRGVMRMDCGGESALALMKAAGAEFLANGIRIKHFLKDLESRGAARKSG